MLIAMPVSWSEAASFCAPKNPSKKSLRLPTDVEVEKRNLQVLFSPRTPKAKVGHLPTAPGMERATGMAPPRWGRFGWRSVPAIYLPNYDFRLSSGYVTSSQETDYGGVSEAAGF
jgi:hypothetical protein